MRPGDESDLERSLRFLRAQRADRTAHSNRVLLDHLIGTWQLLRDWQARPALCDAGLFHSVYGTEHFQLQTISVSMRRDVQGLIGDEAEHLAWLFCVMRRKTFDENLRRDEDFRLQCRHDGTWQTLTRAQFRDLASLTVANALEALPHLSWYERQRLLRACSRYLARFRDCILPSGQRALDVACAVAWWKVWA